MLWIIFHVVEFFGTVSVLHVCPVRGSHGGARAHEGKGGLLDRCPGVFQNWQEALALNALGDGQPGEIACGGEHVNQLDDGGTDP